MASMITTTKLMGLLQNPVPTSCKILRKDLPSVASRRKSTSTVFLYRPSGIQTLPVELLTHIFVLGASSDDPYVESPFLLRPDRAYSSPPSSNFQLLLTHVCHQWREVGLRIPALWATLHFRDKVHIPRAEEYLSRCTQSSSSTLNILIDSIAAADHIPGVTLHTDEVNTIFRLITPHVRRWRALHLKICDNSCKALARQYLSTCGPAPNLETLQLYHFEDYRTTQNLYLATYRPPVVVFDNSLPRLTNVSLIGVNLPWEKSPYLKGLRNLELALHPENIRPTYQLWSEILAQSPDLETLCLHYSGPKSMGLDEEPAWPSVQQVVSLSKLQALTLTDLDPDYISGLLERLRIPNIRQLTLDLPDQDFSSFLEVLTKSATAVHNSSGELNVNSSLQHLRAIAVYALECDSESWTRFLKSASNVQLLEVDFSRLPRKLWRAFMDGLSSSSLDSQGIISPLLPELQVLKVRGLSREQLYKGPSCGYRETALQYISSISWIAGKNEGWKENGVEADVVDGETRASGAREIEVSFEILDQEDDEVDEVGGELVDELEENAE
ncbi:hypothetical protein CPB83DRAFT_832174 [Crepidotus variabilis]|uniref:F-box domain-containing protein n=1 Tax=Crepidotus variabilis TaxID=179855 RepID=A0A9P6EQ38_9AGAR|nr:hypothetical protein CPB83DRAFT_832174 [Crepidotus variabilis]